MGGYRVRGPFRGITWAGQRKLGMDDDARDSR